MCRKCLEQEQTCVSSWLWPSWPCAKQHSHRQAAALDIPSCSCNGHFDTETCCRLAEITDAAALSEGWLCSVDVTTSLLFTPASLHMCMASIEITPCSMVRQAKHAG